MSDYGVIDKLRREHSLDSFDCGKDELNRFLKRQAWNNQQSHSAQTYVLARNLSVLGYYSLAAGSVRHEDVTERVKKGLARHPIPVILLARLAVDDAKRFYEHFDFEPSPSDPYHLLLITKDLLGIVGK